MENNQTKTDKSNSSILQTLKIVGIVFGILIDLWLIVLIIQCWGGK